MSKKRVLTILAIITSVLFGVGVWWLFNTDRLTFTINPGSQSTSSVACGADIVDTYNAAMFYAVRNGSNDLTIDENAVKNLAVEIKSKVGYKNDPTCQTILFWTAVHNDDYQGAKDAYASIKTLHDQGTFTDSNIRSNQPLFTYESYLLQLSGSGTSQAEGSIGG